MLSCSPGARLFTHGGLRGVAVSGACRAWRLRRWAGPAASRLQHRSLRPRQRRSPATTVASAGDIAGLVVFSALPFVAVQALADSEKGKELQARLQARIPHLKREAVERAALREQARGRSRWYGSARPLWLGPLGPAKPPTWLDGSLPGDYGFDPLALGRRPGELDRLVELELLHARWAMLAALGALLPEALQLGGAATFLESRWWNVGYAKLSTEEDLNYLGVAGLHVAGGQGVAIIALCQALLMFGPEYARACGVSALEPLGVYLPGDRDYPGGWLFDPLGLAEWDADAFVDLQVKEVKHGRLAMVAWLGFAAQAVATRVGPVRNLLDVLP